MNTRPIIVEMPDMVESKSMEDIYIYRERERERALVGTMVHTGGSRAASVLHELHITTRFHASPPRKMETLRLAVRIGRIARGRGKSRGRAHDGL
jgi:hypothetical protein